MKNNPRFNKQYRLVKEIVTYFLCLPDRFDHGRALSEIMGGVLLKE